MPNGTHTLSRNTDANRPLPLSLEVLEEFAARSFPQVVGELGIAVRESRPVYNADELSLAEDAEYAEILGDTGDPAGAWLEPIDGMEAPAWDELDD